MRLFEMLDEDVELTKLKDADEDVLKHVLRKNFVDLKFHGSFVFSQVTDVGNNPVRSVEDGVLYDAEDKDQKYNDEHYMTELTTSPKKGKTQFGRRGKATRTRTWDGEDGTITKFVYDPKGKRIYAE